MREVFTNAMGFEFIVDDSGITFKNGNQIAEFPYGSIDSKLKVGMLTNITISGSGIQRVFVALGQDKARFKNAIAYADQMNKKAIPSKVREYESVVKDGEVQKSDIVKNREYKRRCNVCGHVFCFTDNDIKENEKNRRLVDMNRKSAIFNALAVSTVQSSLDTAEADRKAALIKDFTKCPKCNSSNLTKLEDDYVMETEREKSVVTTSTGVNMDEILKLKELLDLGILTQEEFDAKKKQLLGL